MIGHAWPDRGSDGNPPRQSLAFSQNTGRPLSKLYGVQLRRDYPSRRARCSRGRRARDNGAVAFS